MQTTTTATTIITQRHVDAWLSLFPSSTQKRNYGSIVKVFMEYAVENPTVDAIDSFLDHLQKIGRAKQTLNTYRSALSRFRAFILDNPDVALDEEGLPLSGIISEERLASVVARLNRAENLLKEVEPFLLNFGEEMRRLGTLAISLVPEARAE